jgi:sugar-specific transcriptional regulator TrmB
MPKAVLTSLGLNELEAEAYETLLPLGNVPIVTLTRALKRHPQVVYRIVDRLVSLGLAVVEVRQHRRYVRAEDPRVLVHAQAQRLRELEEVLPELRAMQHAPKEATVRVARGNDAVRNLRDRAFHEMPEGETYYILGASGDRLYEILGPSFAVLEKLRIKRKLRKKMLAFESQRKLLIKNEGQPVGVELRYLPETFPAPTSTNIFGNTVAILIWSAEPIVITIESEEIAANYKHFFQSLWKSSRG